jgi:multidrug transporter EmrE-like cation transporter
MELSITPRGIVLIVIASGIMAISSLMLKYSIDRIGGFGGELAQVPADILKLLLEPAFVLGVLLYGGGTLLWMRSISTEPISIGYPILIASSFVIIALGSAYFFNEALTPVKIIGMVIITIGVIVASFG